ncbi:hypothetical protein ACTHQY_08905 [Rhodococcoides corynebacterioides]|uniref:hypothetical protein n=1 Tax=Rhodococcoides corynebacterioides TaxID=53972 RepID=UPI003F7E44FA
MAVDITIIGADGTRLDVSGRFAGRQGIILAAGQVQGIYDAPITTEWTSAATEIGGRSKGTSYEYRDLILGFHVFGDENPMGYEWLDATLRKCFTYERDKWDPTEELARIYVKSKRDLRRLSVQLHETINFQPEQDPTEDEYGNPQYPLRAGQPMWEGKKAVTAWQTSGTSGSGFIEVENPTDRPMFQTWVLTRGTWTVPDVSWTGPKGKRVPGGEFPTRVLPLAPISTVHAGARINLDPMKLMVESWSGTNLLGELAGERFFMHEIPSYTPKTLLPISVTGAPSGGARAELHQPRLWTRPWGMQWQ